MSITTVSDVATDLGRPIDAPESEQVQQWIDRVEGRIARRVPGFSALVSDMAYQSVVIGVVVAVVARKVRNPEGMSYERIDDYGYGLAGGGPVDLTLTDAEWSEVLPDGSGSAFSIIPGRSPW